MKMRKKLAAFLAAAMAASVLVLPVSAEVTLGAVYDFEDGSTTGTDYKSGSVTVIDDTTGGAGKILSLPAGTHAVWQTKRDRDLEFSADLYLPEGTTQVEFGLKTKGEPVPNVGERILAFYQGNRIINYHWGKTLDAAGWEANNWYSVKVVLEKDATRVSDIKVKKRSDTEWKIYSTETALVLGTDEMVGLDIYAASAAMVDNVSIKEYKKAKVSYHYDFDETETKTGNYFDGENINGVNAQMQWVGGYDLNGDKVLKATAGDKAAGRYVWTGFAVEPMDSMIVESRFGADGADVRQMGTYVTQGVSRKNFIVGLASCRYIVLNNTEAGAIQPSPGNSIPNQLITSGFVYNKKDGKLVYKTYYIDSNGNTIVQDQTAGAPALNAADTINYVGLYYRNNNNSTDCTAYYDYLYIDEPDVMKVDESKSSIVPNQRGVLVEESIDIYYNYVIDPKNVGTAMLTAKDGSSAEVSLSTYNGHNIRVTPVAALKYATEYTLTLKGAKDLLGGAAEDYSITFTTGEAVSGSAELITNGGKVTNGDNTVRFTLTTGGAGKSPVTVVVAAYDSETNALLGATAENATVSAESGTIDCTLNTSDSTRFKTEGYRIEAFIWDGLGTMMPYGDKVVFNS